MYKKILKDKVEGDSFFLDSLSWRWVPVCASFLGKGSGNPGLTTADF